MTFLEKLEKSIAKNNSLLCIGLDPDLTKIPNHLLSNEDPVFAFCKEIIDATPDLVCAYKPQMAYFEALGPKGLTNL